MGVILVFLKGLCLRFRSYIHGCIWECIWLLSFTVLCAWNASIGGLWEHLTARQRSKRSSGLLATTGTPALMARNPPSPEMQFAWNRDGIGAEATGKRRANLCLTCAFAVTCLKEYEFCIVYPREFHCPQSLLISSPYSHWTGVSTLGIYLEKR